MYTILDIHTHHPAPQPNAVVCVSPDDFNPIENQLYSVGIHPWKTADALSDDIWEKPWLVHGFRGKPTIAKMLTDTGIWLSFNDKFNDMSVTETPIQFMLAETDESETPIADIITKLSSLKGEDLTATISENVARFLSLNS